MEENTWEYRLKWEDNIKNVLWGNWYGDVGFCGDEVHYYFMSTVLNS
jgi:hypothetical protein